jgi:putative ABC transport system permease protein
MVRAVLKGLLAHKLRLALTAIAVVLGVAFVAGTFVLTDTINKTFDTLFTEISAGTDITVRAASGSATTPASTSPGARSLRRCSPRCERSPAWRRPTGR